MGVPHTAEWENTPSSGRMADQKVSTPPFACYVTLSTHNLMTEALLSQQKKNHL